MNKTVLGFLALAIALVMGAFASADSVTLGGTEQEASILDENINNFVTNTWQPAINASGTMSCNANWDSRYVNQVASVVNNINVTLNNLHVGGVSTTIPYTTTTPSAFLSVRIPENLDAVGTDASEQAFRVVTVTCTGTAGTASLDVFIQRKNMFDFTKMYVDYGDGSSSTIRSDSDEVKDVKPGDTLNFELEGENLYNSDYNVDLDLEVRSTARSGSAVDMDTIDNLEISSGDKDTTSFSATVDTTADNKKYLFDFLMYGTDSYGAHHGFSLKNVKIDVVREKYQITINSIGLNPQSLICDDSRLVTASVKITNDGQKNDNDVKLELVSPSLGISQSFTALQLDSTDEVTKKFTFTVPASAKPGMYDLTAKTYSLGESLSDQQTVKLTVPDCSPVAPVANVTTQPVVAPVQPNVVVVQPTATTPTAAQPVAPVTTAAPESAKEQSGEISTTTLYLAILVILIVILLGGIIGLIVYLLKPSN